MNCPYCQHTQTYLLKDKQRKCSKCKRKFSPKKIAREKQLLDLFIKGLTVREASIESGIHIVTIQKFYDKFRRKLALYSDREYQYYAQSVTEYDEYLYLPKTLKIMESINKLQHFMTLSYQNKVYNLMMPSLKRYQDKSENEQKLMLKYLKFNKVAKITKVENSITKFWYYFETFILKYKGVSDEQFIFYLKEAEVRFNHNKSTLREILIHKGNL